MANLRDIKRRIKSVKSTQQITKAMKMVSAAKLRRAQERALAYRDYADGIREVAVHLAALGGAEGNPLAETRAVRAIDLIAVTSDKGLCGSFNSNVLNASRRFIRERDETPVSVVAVGKKTRDFSRRRGWTIVDEYLDTFRGVNRPMAAAISRQATERFLDGRSDEVWLLYNEFVSVMTRRWCLRRLLPSRAPGRARRGARPRATRCSNRTAPRSRGSSSPSWSSARSTAPCSREFRQRARSAHGRDGLLHPQRRGDDRETDPDLQPRPPGRHHQGADRGGERRRRTGRLTEHVDSPRRSVKR